MMIGIGKEPFSESNPKKTLADYAMVLDMMGQLTGFATEREQVEKIFDIFTIMCGPGSMSYLAHDGEMAGKLLSRPLVKQPEDVIGSLQGMKGDFAKTASGKGLRVLIKHRDQLLGVLELEDVTAPELINHYLNLALNVQSVLGLAIANARLYQTELASRGQIQSYANRLSLLHDISLKLNQSGDRNSVLKSILNGAASITGAELGAIFPVEGDSADILSLYYAPRLKARFGPGQDVISLYRSVVRLRDRFQKDVAHISAQEAAGLGLMLPFGSGHVNDLLIGTMRDAHGFVHSHFVLINKANGAAFTDEDLEVASLLVAQGSVALSNVETFEREHRLADTLLSSLLPGVPLRKDLDLGLIYRSAGQHKIGGDFYEFIDLAGGHLAVAIGDVCGKGLTAASYNAMMKYLLRAYFNESEDPAACLARLNRAIMEEMPEDRFVTMCLALIDPALHAVTIASAGHPHPLMQSGGKVMQLAMGKSLPLGVVPDFKFTNTSVLLEEGAGLLMFTDGIIEARSPEGGLYGISRLTEAYGKSSSLKSQKQVDNLISGLLEFSQGDLKDDAVLLAARLI